MCVVQDEASKMGFSTMCIRASAELRAPRSPTYLGGLAPGWIWNSGSGHFGTRRARRVLSLLQLHASVCGDPDWPDTDPPDPSEPACSNSTRSTGNRTVKRKQWPRANKLTNTSISSTSLSLADTCPRCGCALGQPGECAVDVRGRPRDVTLKLSMGRTRQAGSFAGTAPWNEHRMRRGEVDRTARGGGPERCPG